MNGEAYRAEWERLRAERAAVRRDLVGTLDAIEVKARDPFGLKAKIREHPVLTAGIAAGAGAILVNLLLPADKGGGEPREGSARPAAAGRGPSIFDTLRDAALRAAAPWITRFVEEKLGAYMDPGAPASEAAEDDRAG